MSNDYIRREDVIDKINERQRKLIYCFGFENDAVKIMDIAKSIVIAIPSAQPELESADVAPVVHARWVKPKGMMPPEHHGHYECSECGAWAGRDWLRPWKEILLTNFCPNCGAKMDGKEQTDDSARIL